MLLFKSAKWLARRAAPMLWAGATGHPMGGGPGARQDKQVLNIFNFGNNFKPEVTIVNRSVTPPLRPIAAGILVAGLSVVVISHLLKRR